VAGEPASDRAFSCLDSRRSPVNSALARHENPTDGNLVGRIAEPARGAPGQKSKQLSFATSPSLNEPTAPARRLDGHRYSERAAGVSQRACATSRSRECRPRRSRSSHPVVRNALSPAARCGRAEAPGSRFGLRGCSDMYVGRANESLHRTSARSRPCERLARAPRV
jgi:hypothetical protein